MIFILLKFCWMSTLHQSGLLIITPNFPPSLAKPDIPNTILILYYVYKDKLLWTTTFATHDDNESWVLFHYHTYIFIFKEELFISTCSLPRDLKNENRIQRKIIQIHCKASLFKMLTIRLCINFWQICRHLQLHVVAFL